MTQARPYVSFVDIDPGHRCDTLALSLIDRGIGPGSRVGLLGRNSRAFLETITAVSRTGADLVYLNTSSSFRRQSQPLLLNSASPW